jgi:hypothetical protein
MEPDGFAELADHLRDRREGEITDFDFEDYH